MSVCLSVCPFFLLCLIILFGCLFSVYSAIAQRQYHFAYTPSWFLLFMLGTQGRVASVLRFSTLWALLFDIDFFSLTMLVIRFMK